MHTIGEKKIQSVDRNRNRYRQDRNQSKKKTKESRILFKSMPRLKVSMYSHQNDDKIYRISTTEENRNRGKERAREKKQYGNNVL